MLADQSKARRQRWRPQVRLRRKPGDYVYGPRTAAEMQVGEMRQILIWPLALAHRRFHIGGSASDEKWTSAAEMAQSVTRALEGAIVGVDEAAVKSHWVRQRDPLRHILRHTRPDAPDAPLGTGDMRAHTYGEFVYFHPFVQRFLYQHQAGRPAAGEEAARGGFVLFQRTDLTRGEVDVPAFDFQGRIVEQRTFDLAIDRLNLYVFDCGVAIMVLEVLALGVTDVAADGKAPASRTDRQPSMRTKAPLTVQDALILQNALRRCYPPYWIPEKGSARQHPGEVPSRVKLHDPARGGASIEMIYDHQQAGPEFDRVESTTRERTSPFFRLWRDLLPLRLDGESGESKVDVASWRHVVDERIPSLTYVATIESPTQMRRGDHARLCFVDTPGEGEYAYHKSILTDFEEVNCYDRFWNWGTRQMFSGYSYVVIAKAGDFASDHLVHHFRRHYFQIALLSHMEAAALLTYSNWISEALAKHSRSLGQAFAEDVLRIKEQLLTFVHQYRFTGLSNQLQPAEMQTYWRKHLRLDALFADVSNEIEAARDYLVMQEGRDQAQASTSVAMIAGLVAVIGLPMAFLGTNFVTPDQVYGLPATSDWSWLFGSMAAASLIGLIAQWLTASSKDFLAGNPLQMARILLSRSRVFRNRARDALGKRETMSASRRLRALLWLSLTVSLLLLAVTLPWQAIIGALTTALGRLQPPGP